MLCGNRAIKLFDWLKIVIMFPEKNRKCTMIMSPRKRKINTDAIKFIRTLIIKWRKREQIDQTSKVKRERKEENSN